MKSDIIKEYIDRLLKWLSTVLPATVTVGSAIYRYMLQRIKTIKVEKETLELEKKYLGNKNEVNEEYSGKSDSDVIFEIARPDSKGSGSDDN